MNSKKAGDLESESPGRNIPIQMFRITMTQLTLERFENPTRTIFPTYNICYIEVFYLPENYEDIA